jgi:molybdopterin converting factor small subunit
MVKAKFFGVLRLKSGISTISIEADRVSKVIEKIVLTGKVGEEELKGCIILVGKKRVKLKSKLQDGDEVVFLSPAGGG